jgi:subtilisin family serine protease
MVASYTDPSGYTYSSGTSFSCPLVSGAIAQLLAADPTLTPVEVKDALKSTASQSQAPDNLLGWGIINIEDAYESLQLQLHREEDLKQPVAFSLDQNYPNPFNPSTAISYSLLAVSEVELNIYNVSGQLIVNLVNGIQSSGKYTVHWDAANLPSGLYFCTLRANGQGISAGMETRKMMLIK